MTIKDLEFEIAQLNDMLDSPTCVKCNGRLSKQDSRGWERLQENVWLCPTCISKFQYIKDIS